MILRRRRNGRYTCKVPSDVEFSTPTARAAGKLTIKIFDGTTCQAYQEVSRGERSPLEVARQQVLSVTRTRRVLVWGRGDRTTRPEMKADKDV